MNDKSQQSVANSLEAEKNLLPYMPYLLQDLWALGSSVNQILDLIGTLPLSSDSPKVLDLGCGKVAVSIRIASKFRFDVVGVDAMSEFLKNAGRKSSEYQVFDLCCFIETDILTYVTNEHNFDIVILAALGGIFGNNKKQLKIYAHTSDPAGI